jgi:hypothetical protein
MSMKALMQLLSEKGIISKDELMANIERLHREIREKGKSKYFNMKPCVTR